MFILLTTFTRIQEHVLNTYSFFSNDLIVYRQLTVNRTSDSEGLDFVLHTDQIIKMGFQVLV